MDSSGEHDDSGTVPIGVGPDLDDSMGGNGMIGSQDPNLNPGGGDSWSGGIGPNNSGSGAGAMDVVDFEASLHQEVDLEIEDDHAIVGDAAVAVADEEVGGGGGGDADWDGGVGGDEAVPPASPAGPGSRPETPLSPKDIEITVENAEEDEEGGVARAKDEALLQGCKPFSMKLHKVQIPSSIVKQPPSGRIELGGQFLAANPALAKFKDVVGLIGKLDKAKKVGGSRRESSASGSSGANANKGQRGKAATSKKEPASKAKKEEPAKKKGQETAKAKKATEKKVASTTEKKMFSSSSDSDSDLEEIRKKIMKPSLFKAIDSTSGGVSSIAKTADKPVSSSGKSDQKKVQPPKNTKPPPPPKKQQILLPKPCSVALVRMSPRQIEQWKAGKGKLPAAAAVPASKASPPAATASTKDRRPSAASGSSRRSRSRSSSRPPARRLSSSSSSRSRSRSPKRYRKISSSSSSSRSRSRSRKRSLSSSSSASSRNSVRSSKKAVVTKKAAAKVIHSDSDSDSSSETAKQQSQKEPKKMFVNPLFASMQKKKEAAAAAAAAGVKTSKEDGGKSENSDVKQALMEKLKTLVATADDDDEDEAKSKKRPEKEEPEKPAAKPVERTNDRSSDSASHQQQPKPKGSLFDGKRLLESSHRLKPLADLLKVEMGEGTLNFLKGKPITLSEFEVMVEKASRQLASEQRKTTHLGLYSKGKKSPYPDLVRKHKLGKAVSVSVSDVGKSKFLTMKGTYVKAKENWDKYRRVYVRKRKDVLHDGLKDVKRRLGSESSSSSSHHRHGGSSSHHKSDRRDRDSDRPPSKHHKEDKPGAFRIPKGNKSKGSSEVEGMKSVLESGGSKKPAVETNKYNLQYRKPGPLNRPQKNLFEEEMNKMNKNAKKPDNFSLMDVMSNMKDKKKESEKVTDIRAKELAAKLRQDKIRQERVEREMKTVMELQVKDKADFSVFSVFTSWKESIDGGGGSEVEMFKCCVCNVQINGGKVEVIGHLRTMRHGYMMKNYIEIKPDKPVIRPPPPAKRPRPPVPSQQPPAPAPPSSSATQQHVGGSRPPPHEERRRGENGEWLPHSRDRANNEGSAPRFPIGSRQ